jgi:hypothetical protein
MPGFHSHDDDFLYEVQRRDRKESAPPRTQRPPSVHRNTAAQAAAEAAAATQLSAPSPSRDFVQRISLTLKEAALQAGKTVYFLRAAIWEHRLPAQLAGKRFIILRDELVRFISTLPAATSRRK